MLHNDTETFEQLILRTSEYLDIKLEIIEKDYFVTVFLGKLVSKVPEIVFKGGTSLSNFVMKSSSFWTCILTIKLYWKRRHIGTSAKKNHTYESPLYRVQILIILYSNAPYIAIANKNMSQSCVTMGMAAAGEWMSFTMSEKRADNHQLSALSLIQIQFSKSFQVQLQVAATF